MSVQAMSWVFEHSSAQGAVRLVLLAIANHADKDGRHSWASVRQIGEEARCSERKVQYALRELEAAGEIVNIGPSTHRTHTYELPAMTTLFEGGAVSAPAVSAPVQSVQGAARAGRSLRRRGVQSATGKGADSAPEPSTNHPKATVLSSRPRSSELCQLLADLIVANGSKPPTITKAWLDSERLLLGKDARPAEEAEALIRWCQADPFWRSNILSMPTFREKYDRLRLRQVASVRPAGSGRAAEIHAEAERLREAGL